MERFGWFQAGGAGGGSLQRGALRVNCIDCLDRTNVVQGWLARKQLERLLAQLGLLAPGTPLPEAFPEARPYRMAVGCLCGALPLWLLVAFCVWPGSVMNPSLSRIDCCVSRVCCHRFEGFSCTRS